MIVLGTHGPKGAPQLPARASDRSEPWAGELRVASVGWGTSAQPLSPVRDPQSVLEEILRDAQGLANASRDKTERLFAVFVNGQTIKPYRDNGPPGGILAVSSSGNFYRLFREPLCEGQNGQSHQVYYGVPLVDQAALTLTARDIGAELAGRSCDLVAVASLENQFTLEILKYQLQAFEAKTSLFTRMTCAWVLFGVVTWPHFMKGAVPLLMGAFNVWGLCRAVAGARKLIQTLSTEGFFRSAEENFSTRAKSPAAEDPALPKG